MESRAPNQPKTRGRICVLRLGYYPEDARVPKEVRALCEAGYEVDVICLRRKGQKTRENVRGAQVYRLRHGHRRESLLRYLWEYGIGILKMFVFVTVFFFRRRYHCIQVNTLPDPLVFVTIIPRLFGAKILLDMHEPTPELFVTKYGSDKHKWAVKLITLLEQMSLKYATAVLTVNDRIKQRFVQRGADAQKMHIVRNVPEKDLWTGQSPRSTEGGFNLMIHGMIARRYGHETVIRALALVRDRIENVHLTIAGGGDDEERIQRLTGELGCSDIVSFLGWVPLTRIQELIASTDIGLVPLLRLPFSELCQPNKLFDFVSGKRAVIVSRLEAIEESFDDSCVMFCEPGSAEDLARCIMDLYENPEKRHNLAENAYRRYDAISWRHSKKTYLDVVDSLIDRNTESLSKETNNATDSLRCEVG